MTTRQLFIVINLRFPVTIDVSFTPHKSHITSFKEVLNTLLFCFLKNEDRIILTTIFTLTNLDKDVFKWFVHRGHVNITTMRCNKGAMFFCVWLILSITFFRRGVLLLIHSDYLINLTIFINMLFMSFIGSS